MKGRKRQSNLPLPNGALSDMIQGTGGPPLKGPGLHEAAGPHFRVGNGRNGRGRTKGTSAFGRRGRSGHVADRAAVPGRGQDRGPVRGGGEDLAAVRPGPGLGCAGAAGGADHLHPYPGDRPRGVPAVGQARRRGFAGHLAGGADPRGRAACGCQAEGALGGDVGDPAQHGGAAGGGGRRRGHAPGEIPGGVGAGRPPVYGPGAGPGRAHGPGAAPP